jgi:hypothetical protein
MIVASGGFALPWLPPMTGVWLRRWIVNRSEMRTGAVARGADFEVGRQKVSPVRVSIFLIARQPAGGRHSFDAISVPQRRATEVIDSTDLLYTCVT